MDGTDVRSPLLLPLRQRGGVEPLGVLAPPDPFPPAVLEAIEDLARGVSARHGLSSAEDATLPFSDDPELRIHLTSMSAPPVARTSNRRSVENT